MSMVRDMASIMINTSKMPRDTPGPSSWQQCVHAKELGEEGHGYEDGGHDREDLDRSH
jgi:hypothetical protein